MVQLVCSFLSPDGRRCKIGSGKDRLGTDFGGWGENPTRFFDWQAGGGCGILSNSARDGGSGRSNRVEGEDRTARGGDAFITGDSLFGPPVLTSRG